MDYDEYLDRFLQLKRSLINDNRYFPKSNSVLKDIELSAKYRTEYLETGSVIWRARKYKEKEETGKLISILEHIDPSFLAEYAHETYAKNCTPPFWGYDEKDSYVPSKTLATDGRANPKYIPYLYAAREIETALAEIRPRLRTLINVAKIEPTDRLKLFNLAFWGASSTEYDRLWRLMSSEFSTPVDAELEDYLASQYLSEFIKSLGFDGVQYYSASRGYTENTFKGNGVCLVIFSTNKCRAVASRIYRINSIKVDAECVLPFDDSELW